MQSSSKRERLHRPSGTSNGLSKVLISQLRQPPIQTDLQKRIPTAGESQSGGGLLGMQHQTFRSAHAQETTHMHRTMNTVQKSPTIAGEASGSQAGHTLKEHDYIGLSERHQQHSQSENVGKELNIRRTELQLGLPGSPENDTKEAAACSKPQMGTFEHDKNESQQQQGKDKEVRAKQQRVDALPWHLKQPQDCVAKHVVGGAAEDSAAQPRAPVGWPPVQSFRKNSLPTPQTEPAENASSTAPSAAAATAPQQKAPVQPSASLLVKVYMDGVSIGRKVNLRTHSSYEKLSVALEEMFRWFINGQAENGHSKTMKDSKLQSEGKKLNFIYGSDYVLTYEDKDGDLMLVGDVPWGMFVGNVKRLRIMKGSEAIG